MVVLLLLAFPLLILVNPYLAMVSLAAGIAGMYFQRTQASKREGPRLPSQSYKAGYEE